MPNETRHAFEHPEVRAEATSTQPLDRISLRDHVVEVEIGAFQLERGTTQRVCFNLVVEVAPHDAARTDDVDRILSYDTLLEAIAAELEAERLNLLETLAERIAERILRAPQAQRCFVRIEKLDRGPGALGVEIVRSAAKREIDASMPSGTPAPTVVYLSNSAIASPALAGWLDALVARGAPAILCVGPGDLPRPRAEQAAAQRRIDLLAIEQNAWVLAGRDRRCVVVGTRTELDWSMRHDQITVWAPSKLVLDSVRPPGAGAGDGPALAAWFARLMQARALLFVGADAPREAGGGEGLAAIPVAASASDDPALPADPVPPRSGPSNSARGTER
ncbi:dihydroneopterin aldolase [Profundibacterium mesophilum]|uniref:dihydroneopterin aldolase n=1 Tax=Profundibacterium mesophilum KAUST100406-0324 TaxID=1037889 RepID=A0A921NZ93_9RHOB|nr:dihydroneopterin aldolase [Profundibacterium mesophilum]KAF0677394.1 dihydroneopterin aldolase [Profundibacterium mesophilum KAUST100406-0324]